MPEIPSFYYKSLPDGGELITSPGLACKTDGEGLLPFCGETTVFLLPENVRCRLSGLQEKIYTAAGQMLCKERLKESSFHMTLHDLWNEADGRPAPTYSHAQIKAALDSIRRDYPQTLTMRGISLLSMVSTSVVLGLVPGDEKSRAALADMYSRLQALWPLPYGLTPHVTLAYYRPGAYPEPLWRRLGESFSIEEFEFRISAKSLVFQCFEDMNKYCTI